MWVSTEANALTLATERSALWPQGCWSSGKANCNPLPRWPKQLARPELDRPLCWSLVKPKHVSQAAAAHLDTATSTVINGYLQRGAQPVTANPLYSARPRSPIHAAVASNVTSDIEFRSQLPGSVSEPCFFLFFPCQPESRCQQVRSERPASVCLRLLVSDWRLYRPALHNK